MGSIAVWLCDNPVQAAAQFRASYPKCLVVIEPVPPVELIARWCGTGVPEAFQRATDIASAAARLLEIHRPAQSLPERAWQAESTGSPVLARIAAAVFNFTSGDGVDGLRTVLRSLYLQGYTPVELFRDLLAIGLQSSNCVAFCIDSNPAWNALVTFLTDVIEQSAAADFVIIADAALWERLRESLPSHARAVLAEHVVDRRGDAGSKWSPEPAESIDQLRHRAKQAVAKAAGVGPEATQVAMAPGYGEARSLAELLLHRALDADPRTSGLFNLNADGGFMFGQARAEIDLLCVSLNIAIEVDGYFHFQDTQAYRRDRAKDYLMQCQGYLVLRFLAEDVPTGLERIVEKIADAVALRRAGLRMSK